jgi:hypothetical protein
MVAHLKDDCISKHRTCCIDSFYRRSGNFHSFVCLQVQLSGNMLSSLIDISTGYKVSSIHIIKFYCVYVF